MFDLKLSSSYIENNNNNDIIDNNSNNTLDDIINNSIIVNSDNQENNIDEKEIINLGLVKNNKIDNNTKQAVVKTYKKGIKYAVNVNTWINGIKIDLGSFIFKPTDTVANDFGITSVSAVNANIALFCRSIEIAAVQRITYAN